MKKMNGEVCWKILSRYTKQKKNAFIYEIFIKQMVEEREIPQNDLPSKKHIKGKISSIKMTLKKKIQRFIV